MLVCSTRPLCQRLSMASLCRCERVAGTRPQEQERKDSHC